MTRGVPSWHTSSTAPTSMPSSSEAVATRTRSSPARRRFSASSRTGRARAPWWAATLPSPRRWVRWCATRSHSRRVLVKTMLVRCSPASAAIRSYTSSHCSCVVTAESSPPGASMARSRTRACPSSTMVQGRPPVRNAPMSAMGCWVADSPMRCARRVAVVVAVPSASSRSRDRARCAPRRSSAMAWISSTMTVSTPARFSRPRAVVRTMYRLSGVVTRMWGGRRAFFCRSAGVVSPVRTRTRTPPTAPTRADSSASGPSRLCWMSWDRALSGET